MSDKGHKPTSATEPPRLVTGNSAATVFSRRASKAEQLRA